MIKTILLFLSIVSFNDSSFGQKDSIVVNFFLLEDCVICQSYSIKINELALNFGDEFTFVGYFPNFSSKKEEITSFKEKYNINFDLKTDYFKTKSKLYNVKVTPEVVVVNESTGETLYQGRIDDEFVKIGKRRRVVTKNELLDALTALKNKQEILISTTEPIGCFINYNDLN